MTPILTAKGIDVTFRSAGSPDTHAVIDAGLTLYEGTTVALVGESGSGKTTLARAILGLLQRDRGDITVFGDMVASDPRHVPQAVRRKMQPLFQDPGASLDPMWRVGDLLREAMQVTDSVAPALREAEIAKWMDALGLSSDLLLRRPHELSGGQKQRMALARALITGAKLLVLDEPLTALDPPSQRAASDLLLSIKRNHGVSSILVSHDIGLVRTLADHVVVMYRGRVVESGTVNEVFDSPKHPYTSLLLASVLPVNPNEARARLASLPEDHVTDPVESGCAFAPRCPLAVDACRTAVPLLLPRGASSTHFVACPIVV